MAYIYRETNVQLVFATISVFFLLLLQVDTQGQSDCDICGEKKCSRHLNVPSWKGLFVDRGLDEAVDSVST